MKFNRQFLDSELKDYYRWYDEPDDTRIKIEDDYRKSLIERSIKKAGNVDLLSKEIELNRVTIYNYLNGIGMRVGGLKKILNYLDIKQDRINHKVLEISWGFKPNIKMKSKNMAILLAASLADGHLSDQHFMYKNKENELIDRVKNSLINIFGDAKIRENKDRNGTSYFTTSVGVRRVLEKLGSPRGKKLHLNPRVPKIIMNGTKEMKKRFIQQFFDDEGWCEKEHLRIAISQSVDCTDQIPKEFLDKMIFGKKYTSSKIPEDIKEILRIPNLLKDIQLLLKEDFDILFSFRLKRIAKYKRPDYTYVSASWDLQCYQRDEIKKFEKRINFGLSRKKMDLHHVLRRNRAVSQNILLHILNIAIKETKKKGYFRNRDISQTEDLPPNIVRKRLNVLVRKGLFTNDKGRYIINFEI